MVFLNDKSTAHTFPGRETVRKFFTWSFTQLSSFSPIEMTWFNDFNETVNRVWMWLCDWTGKDLELFQFGITVKEMGMLAFKVCSDLL